MSALPPSEGTHTLAVGDLNGEVVLQFERSVKWVALDTETARNVAEQIARRAYKVRFGDDPTTHGKSVISDQLVARLRIRVRNMVKSMEGQAFEIQAAAIVDAVLTEVV